MANCRQLLSGTLAGLALAIAVRSLPAQDAPTGRAKVPPVDSNQERQRQEEVARLSRAKARSLELTVGKQDAARAELARSQSFAGRINDRQHLRRSLRLDCRGASVALASIYRWYHPHRTATVELVSVAEGPVGAENEVVRWTARPPVSRSNPSPRRRRPNRAKEGSCRSRSGRDFPRAWRMRREKVSRELRLLGQPVYRYESAGARARRRNLRIRRRDRPGAWLLLETHLPKDAAKPIWRYALARMNIDELEIQYKSAFVQLLGQRPRHLDESAGQLHAVQFRAGLVKPDESRATPERSISTNHSMFILYRSLLCLVMVGPSW
jgi:hypothetical protein